MSRLDALFVPCVECGAKEGEPCKGIRGPRIALHATRIEFSVLLLKKKRLQKELNDVKRNLKVYQNLVTKL